VRDFFRIERAPRPSLRRHVACVWTDRSDRSDPLLPDAAVELVWSGRGLFVRGADTRAHAVDAFPDRTFVGVRFRPGAAADVLGLHGAELADARVGVSEIWGVAEMARIEARLSECLSPTHAAALLEDVVSTRVCARPDRAVEAVVAALDRSRAPVRELADRLGLSERQLLRRCVDALGYGPKTLDRILRFQRFRALAARRHELGLARLAALAGYADQPHLTRECRRLAGESPASLLARGRMTVSFKTARASIQ
jgi:AraC-like DNA-binding protein